MCFGNLSQNVLCPLFVQVYFLPCSQSHQSPAGPRKAGARLCLSPAHSGVRGSLPGTWGPCGVFGHP